MSNIERFKHGEIGVPGSKYLAAYGSIRPLASSAPSKRHAGQAGTLEGAASGDGILWLQKKRVKRGRA